MDWFNPDPYKLKSIWIWFGLGQFNHFDITAFKSCSQKTIYFKYKYK